MKNLKSLPALAFLMTGIFLTFVIISVAISNGVERDDIYQPPETGIQPIDEWIRLMDAASRSDFKNIYFFSTANWIIYLTIFLSFLGAAGGLLKLYSTVQTKPHRKFSSERRENLATLSVAIAACGILGPFTVLSGVRKKYLLDKFYTLEVHLVRFEGLLFNSFAISANTKLVSTFFIYLFGYFARIQTNLSDISSVYEFVEIEDFQTAWGQLSDSLTTLKDRGFVHTDNIGAMIEAEGDEALLNALRSLEAMQENVRRQIRRLES